MYVSPNFRTLRELRDAVAAGRDVAIFQPSPFGTVPVNGTADVEGPHFPEPHRWYAVVTVRDRRVVAVQ